MLNVTGLKACKELINLSFLGVWGAHFPKESDFSRVSLGIATGLSWAAQGPVRIRSDNRLQLPALTVLSDYCVETLSDTR